MITKILVKENSALLSLITVLLILTSKDTLLFGTNSNTLLVACGYACVFSSVMFMIFYSSIKQFGLIYPRNSFVVLGILLFLLVSTGCLNLDIGFKYIFQALLLVGAYLYTNLVSFAKFRQIFCNLIYIIALGSLVAFVMYYCCYGILSYAPVISNVNNVEYYFIGISIIPCKVAYTIYRAYGIFREPGMFMVFLNLAIIFELFYDTTSIRYRRVIVLILSLLTTVSTAGYIGLLAIILIFTFRAKISTGKRVIIICLVISMIAIVLSVVGYAFFFNKIFLKIINGGSSSASRFDSILINILLLLDKPQFILSGLGFHNVETNFVIKALEIGSLAGVHNTNTFFKMLSVNGMIFFIIYMLSLALFWKNYFKFNYSYLLLIVFCVLLSNEDMMFNILTYILPFYSFRKHIPEKVIS